MRITNSPSSFLNLSLRLWYHLSSRRQRQFGLVLGLMLVSALADVVSVGAVLPFLGIFTVPDRVFSFPLVAAVAPVLGIRSADELMLPFAAAFATAALIAGAIRILLLWVNTRLTAASGSELSIEVYRRTLYQPYAVHVGRNSSDVISSTTNNVNGVVFGVVLPVQVLISSAMTLVVMVLALMAIDPMVTLEAAVAFGGSYGLVSWVYQRRLHHNSQRIARGQAQVIRALQESLGGIRDVLLSSTQTTYCGIYGQADLAYRRAAADNAFIGQSPRYTMEAIGMVLITIIAYGFSRNTGGLAAALPVLGALAIAAQRILPVLHQIYGAWVSISGNHTQLSDIIAMLDQPLPADVDQPAPGPLPFNDSICAEDVRFRYSSEGPWILDGLNITIPKGALIGVVGSTGGGKSTALDLLMGLLEPTDGHILVDGQPIEGKCVRMWQQAIAHVPQSIYLADTTLAENIAFGVPRDAVDMDRLREVAHQAQIADFIESRPGAYDAFVGERGISLSGGELQRIGIARALYRQASVLVLDEATSALDNTTEQAVMEAIEGLRPRVTVLLVAHRLSTLRGCDTILELEHGRVVAQGSYDQLLECSSSFRQAAQTRMAGSRLA